MVNIGKDKDKNLALSKEKDLLWELENFELPINSLNNSSKISENHNNPIHDKISKILEKSKENYIKMLEEEEKEKEDLKKRDYEVYDRMSYKLTERKYHMSGIF